MGKSKNKKKSPVTLFFLFFGAVIVAMFIANWNSALEEELRFALNGGVAKLLTYDNLLVTIGRDNKIYIWDWNNLEAEYIEKQIESEQAVLADADTVISVKRENPRAIMVAGLKDSKNRRTIQLFLPDGIAYLRANRSGQAIVLAMVQSDTAEPTCEIRAVDPRDRKTSSITNIIGFNTLRDLAVSDDGEEIVVVGEKNNLGWIGLVDIKTKQLLWEKELPEVALFFSVVFSPDGKAVYARGSDCTTYKIDPATGELLDKLLPIKENKDTLDIQTPQMTTVSSDGKLVASTVFGVVFIWDCRTGERIFRVSPGHKLVSGIVFSPDSKFLATSDMRQSGTIKIWKMPEH